MTDFADACFSCGGHLRSNVWSGCLCPECEEKHRRGEITAFGDQLEQLTEVHGDPMLAKKRRVA